MTRPADTDDSYGGDEGGFLGYEDDDGLSTDDLASFISAAGGGASKRSSGSGASSSTGSLDNIMFDAPPVSARSQPRLLQAPHANQIHNTSREHIKECFARFDMDGSGDLDTFELANAVAALVGRSPSTSQVMAMIKGVGDRNTLTLDDFEHLVHTFNWDDAEADAAATGLGPLVYELEFGDQKLGFRVRSVPERGIIVVSQVSSPLIRDFVGVEDTVLAINGAPLGFVTDHQVLAKKIGALGRPVRITFVRYRADDDSLVLQAPNADVEAAQAARALGVMDDHMANTPRSLSDRQIREVFTTFDRDATGDLNTFELSNAVAALLGRPTSTREIWAMVESVGTEGSSSLTLDQFRSVIQKFDWDAADLKESLPGSLFEHTFSHEKLGFGFQVHESGLVTVSKVGSVSLDGILCVGDSMIAINGAPIGVVDDSRAFIQRLRFLPRPMRVTFERIAVDTGSAEQELEFDEFKQQERTPGGGDILALTLLSDAQIMGTFARFDRDGEGEMNVFDLGGALAEVLGRPVSTREIWGMLSFGELEGERSLNCEEFVALLRSYDWTEPTQRGELPDNVFEHVFRDEKLGFGFQVDDDSGFVKVSKVGDLSLVGIVELDDKIVAINGAPLGVDEDPRDLVRRLRPLSRPIRITFERTFEESLNGDALGGGAQSHESVYLDGLSSARVAEVFMEFDKNQSGDLDAFELADALRAILGRSPTTREVWGMMSHGELDGHASLKLDMFHHVLRSFDWAEPSLQEPLPENVFECTFADDKLGLAVVVDAAGAVVVSKVQNDALEGIVEVDDQVIAVNGAPIGFIENTKALVARLRTLSRPLRITFERHWYNEDGTAWDDSAEMVPDFDPDVEDVGLLQGSNSSGLSGLRITDTRHFTDLEIEECFSAFDSDGDGGLDTFELANALDALTGTGRPWTTPKVMALLREAGAEDYSLSLPRFAHLVRTHDWAADFGDAGEVVGDEGSILDEALYEVVCAQESIGFTVATVANDRGALVVTSVEEGSAVEGVVGVGDALVAINGAPLGFVSSPEIVLEKMVSLGRPVRVTLERLAPHDDTVADAAVFDAADAASDMDDAKAVFASFDPSATGFMESFNLRAAFKALFGPDANLTSAEVEAMVAAASVEKCRLGLPQFFQLARAYASSQAASQAADSGTAGDEGEEWAPKSRAVQRARDWGAPRKKGGKQGGGGGPAALRPPPERYEVECGEVSLGFRVRAVPSKGALVVSRVLDPSLAGVVGVNDRLVSVNGAPLGFVSNAAALNRRVSRLARPLAVTFERYDPGSAADDFGRRVSAGRTAPAAFASVGSGVALDRIADVFTAFDTSAGGVVSAFDLGAALGDLAGQQPSSAQVAGLVKAARAKARALRWIGRGGGNAEPLLSFTLAQFADAAQAFDLQLQQQRQQQQKQGQGQKQRVSSANYTWNEAGGGSGEGDSDAPPVTPPAAADEWWIDTARSDGGDDGDGTPPRASSSSSSSAAASSSASATVVAGPAPLSRSSFKGGRVVELRFRNDNLGFKVRGVLQPPPVSAANVAILAPGAATAVSGPGKGDKKAEKGDLYPATKSKAAAEPDTGAGGGYILVVSSVSDPALAGIVGVNDRVLAVNGAPLGLMQDHRAVLAAIAGLRRPLRIAFQRYDPTQGSKGSVGWNPGTAGAQAAWGGSGTPLGSARGQRSAAATPRSARAPPLPQDQEQLTKSQQQRQVAQQRQELFQRQLLQQSQQLQPAWPGSSQPSSPGGTRPTKPYFAPEPIGELLEEGGGGGGGSVRSSRSEAGAATAAVKAAASARATRRGVSTMDQIDLSTIVGLLDGLKVGWGLRFAPAFGAVGLEDVGDLADVTPAELEALTEELGRRGAKIRHLRLIRGAVLGLALPPSLAAAHGASGGGEARCHGGDSGGASRGEPWPGGGDAVEGAEEAAFMRSLPVIAEDGGGDGTGAGAAALGAALAEPLLAAAASAQGGGGPMAGVEVGNVAALVALYHHLGGVNWVAREGWRGERSEAGDMRRAKAAGLHGVGFHEVVVRSTPAGQRGGWGEEGAQQTQAASAGESGGGDSGGDDNGGGDDEEGGGGDWEGDGDGDDAAAASPRGLWPLTVMDGASPDEQSRRSADQQSPAPSSRRGFPDSAPSSPARLLGGGGSGFGGGSAEDGAAAQEARRRPNSPLGQAVTGGRRKAKKRRVLQVVTLQLKFNGLAGRLSQPDDDHAHHADDDASRPGTASAEGQSPPAQRLPRPMTGDGGMLALPSLRSLDLSGNSLSGPLPGRALGLLVRLETLNLSQNRLDGCLPRSAPTQDLSLAAGAGRVAGGLKALALPFGLTQDGAAGAGAAGHGAPLGSHEGGSLSALTRLRSLSLRGNVLTGPLGGGRLPASLTHLNLSANRFTGRLPRDLFHMDGLQVLILDDNRLTGTVSRLPPAIEVATFRRNRLSGDLGLLAVCHLKGLAKLYLDENDWADGVAYAAEERLCREAKYGASRCPPPAPLAAPARSGHAPAHHAAQQPSKPHPEPSARTSARVDADVARRRASAEALAEPGDDAGEARLRVVRRVLAEAAALSAAPSEGHPLTGWSGGCPKAEVRVVTPRADARWRARNASILAKATGGYLRTSSKVREEALLPPGGGTGPYTVVWLEGLREFRRAGAMPVDRFRPRPTAPYRPKSGK